MSLLQSAQIDVHTAKFVLCPEKKRFPLFQKILSSSIFLFIISTLRQCNHFYISPFQLLMQANHYYLSLQVIQLTNGEGESPSNEPPTD